MLAMLVVLAVVMNDCVHAKPSSESDFYEQLFMKTFFQDSWERERFPRTNLETIKHKSRLANEKITAEKVTHNGTQSNMTHQEPTSGVLDNVTQKTKEETKPNAECQVDGKKCAEFEVDFTDREDHNIQLVDEMFVNTDNEITSLQAHELEDPSSPSIPDTHNGPAQNTGPEDAEFSR